MIVSVVKILKCAMVLKSAVLPKKSLTNCPRLSYNVPFIKNRLKLD